MKLTSLPSFGPFTEERLEEIRAHSLTNCHAIGVDSLWFDSRTRMFITRPNHTLHLNYPPFTNEMSIAVHGHRCDVTLRTVYGEAFNVRPVFRPGTQRLDAYRYESPLRHGFDGAAGERRSDFGNGKFTAVSFPLPLQCEWAIHRIGRTTMWANDLHTVYVPRGTRAAWLVFEGDPDARYDPTCYSLARLEDFDFSSINHPMTTQELRNHLLVLLDWQMKPDTAPALQFAGR